MKTSCTAWHRKDTTYVRVVIYLLSLPWVSSCLHISWIVQVVVYISFHDHSTVTYSITRNVTCQGLQTWPPHVEKILEPQIPGLETWKSSPLLLPWKTDPEVTLQRNRFGEDVPRPEDLWSVSPSQRSCRCAKFTRCHDWESIEISMGSSSCDSCFSQSHLFA